MIYLNGIVLSLHYILSRAFVFVLFLILMYLREALHFRPIVRHLRIKKKNP